MTRLLALLLGVAFVALGATTPAAAHEGTGTIDVVGADAGEQTVTYRVRVTFVADGHGAPDATVTATPILDGTPQTPVPLQATGEAGIYAGTVSFPQAGAWTVRFTSIRPNATIERPETIAASATTTPATTTTVQQQDQAPLDTEEPAGNDESTAIPIIAVLVAVTAAVLVSIVIRRWSASRASASERQ